MQENLNEIKTHSIASILGDTGFFRLQGINVL